MVEDRVQSLAYAVRGRVVLKYLGQLALMLAVINLVPCITSVALGETTLALRQALVSLVLTGTGLALGRLPAPRQIQTNEALVVSALIFVLSPLLMTYPLSLSGLSFTDAVFEAVSGVTTTGLTTLATIEDKSVGFLFARAWMQWYGGLGIVVLSVALLMGHIAAARRLAEPMYTGEDVVATTRTHARRVLGVYVIITLGAILALWWVLDDGLTALLHALTAVSTGGFSSRDASLGGLPDYAAPAAMGAALLGAVSLPLYYRAWHSGWRTFVRDAELKALFVAGLAITVLVAILNATELGWGGALWHGALMGLSAQTGTGFATIELAALEPAARVALIGSMLVGGSVGSTTGGIKLLRLLILLRLVEWTIQRSTLARHAVVEPRLAGRSLEADDIIRAFVLVALFMLVIVVSWVVFVAAGYEPLDALFEVTSATATVGLSAGITRPELEPALKWILCFDMLAGRLEIVALLIVLYPRTWFGKREQLP